MLGENQSPIGIIWSAVPLPCYVDVMKSPRGARQRGQNPVKWGEILYEMTKPVAHRHHMVSGTLAVLKYLVIYVNVKQDSGLDRRQRPVEWGEIPSVHPFIRPSVRPPSGWPSDRAGRPTDPPCCPSDPSSWPSNPSSQPSDPSNWCSDPSSRPSHPSSWPSDPAGWPSDPEG